MNRKSFLKNTAVTAGGMLLFRDLLAQPKDPVYGHNGFTYRMNKEWSKLKPSSNPVKDCHEMVQDSKGRIILLTNETKNNVIFYDKSGKLLKTWGHNFPGAHGLTIQKSGGEDFLFITDIDTHEVYKTTIDGKVLFSVAFPSEIAAYTKREQFVPTETAIRDNGEFFVADGYGLQYVIHYDANGKLLAYFGGRGDGDQFLDNAHGITIDNRNGTETLLVTDRTRNCFKRYSLAGELQEVIKLDGACVCRPVLAGENLYAAVLRSPNLDKENSGFVTILDKNNKVISNIGGSKPEYHNGKLHQMSQAEKIFDHPHDVCVDNDGNLYVAQWNSGQVYPYKFTRT